MGDSFRVNLGKLRRRSQQFAGPEAIRAINDLPKSKAVAALIAQSIADNFDKEGPGWAPLKGKTLRLSVGKGQLKAAQRLAAYDMGGLKKTKTGTAVNKKKLKGRMAEFHERTEKYLVRDERAIRKGGGEVGRMILQRTGLLKKCATTPGASGVNKQGKSGSNIYRVEGTTIIWGVNLIYARAMNRGVEKLNIPARPFLVVREDWMRKIRAYLSDQVQKILWDAIGMGK